MNQPVRTKKGLIEGTNCGSYTVYKGIPYAEPPVGNLRWKAPKELKPWSGIYRAVHFGNMCFQELPDAEHPVTGRYQKEFYNNPDFIPPMSEDCLYLNIWAPNKGSAKKLPVAFWIHGGGFGGGYGSELEFDGETYCRKDVILVTVNYRLNIYGFLAHPWLSEEDEKGISGNYGILDQIEALKWVRENIEVFGGDPDNITVFGQSAGSMSTQVLVSSPLTEGMISKAIMQSGISCEENILLTPDLKEEEEYGKQFVALTGTGNLEELRKLSPGRLAEAKNRFDGQMWKQGTGIVMVPSADGYVLTETVSECWKSGKMKDIPYMLGCVTDDLGTGPDEAKEGRPGRILEECRKWSFQTETVYNLPSYVYHFARRLPGDNWGAFHTAEVWYMFKTLGRCWRPMTDSDYRLSEEMVTYWTNFMKTGIPASSETENWEPCTGKAPYVKLFS